MPVTSAKFKFKNGATIKARTHQAKKRSPATPAASETDPTNQIKLSVDEAQLLLAVKDGADIYAFGEAGLLREMQRRGYPVHDMKTNPKAKAQEGDLFTICEPRMGGERANANTPTAGRLAYFGVRTLKAGIELAEKTLMQAAK